MADITITSKRKGGVTNHYERKTDRPVEDSWDGTFKRNHCVFCGHHRDQHGSSAQMIVLPGQTKRKRAGLAALWCHQCAEAKETEQVVCYKAPTDMGAYAIRVGIVVHGMYGEEGRDKVHALSEEVDRRKAWVKDMLGETKAEEAEVSSIEASTTTHRSVVCPTCHAGSGQPCEYPSGWKNWTGHASRRKLAGMK